jgi:hypothetical protein
MQSKLQKLNVLNLTTKIFIIKDYVYFHYTNQ